MPVLWDAQTGRIVSNESADIVRMFNGVFDGVAADHVDLYPPALRAEIDEINSLRLRQGQQRRLQGRLRRAARRPTTRPSATLFAALAELEERLGRRRFLVGDEITEADWRLFPTLVRFDAVYYSHFKCNERRLVDYPNLWGYTRDLYRQPGIAATVAMDQIKRHYYTTHDFLNPSRIIPGGPAIDLTAPPDSGAPR